MKRKSLALWPRILTLLAAGSIHAEEMLPKPAPVPAERARFAFYPGDWKCDANDFEAGTVGALTVKVRRELEGL